MSNFRTVRVFTSDDPVGLQVSTAYLRFVPRSPFSSSHSTSAYAYPLLQRVGAAGAARHQQQGGRSTIRSTARADSTAPATTILPDHPTPHLFCPPPLPRFSSPTTATTWHRHHPCCRLNRRAALSLSYGLETARHVFWNITQQQRRQQECGSPQMSRPRCLDIPLSSPLAVSNGEHIRGEYSAPEKIFK